MKTLEERKTENKNLLEETQKLKNEEIKENIKIHEILKRGISQEYSSSY